VTMKHVLRTMIRQRLGRLVRRMLPGSDFNARYWSNDELRRFAHLFQGDVINVSGGADLDKQGGRYREYFSSNLTYWVSNYRVLQGVENEFLLDLETADVPSELVARYDVVFSHTVLEHVFDVQRAVENLCLLSRDVIITVVPFLQSFHRDSWYADYWRFSPLTVKRLFERRGFATIYLTWNEDALGNLYVFHVCSRVPCRWEIISRQQPTMNMGPGVERDRLVYGSVSARTFHFDLDESGCP
jgi:hypothetical protein